MAGNKKKIDDAYVQEAENAISDYSRTVKYTITDYSFEFIVDKLEKERYYIPEYQREFIWPAVKQSKFIESLLMGLPIPFVFFWQDSDGRMEIVDGSQRLRTIQSFMTNELKLKGLETLTEVNGLKFSDFSESLQLKFAEKAIRIIILDHSTDAITRTEMFARINTGGTMANEAEIRRGSLPGPFMDMVTELSSSEEFVELTPISKPLVKSREREELITRFFAYLERYREDGANESVDMEGYKDKPKIFYFNFVDEMNNLMQREIEEFGKSKKRESLESEFRKMLHFVKAVSPNGFTKSQSGNQVPRVRFEAIAVGTALALREKNKLIDINPDITPALRSVEFEEATKSDAANVKSKLLKRIKLLKDWLLEQ
tara:strand:- start:2397 stop:3512 length:1116 start_codon:yes stop_codon:yes gene_type:complete